MTDYSNDIEEAEESCPKCHSDLSWRSCSQCEDGEWEDTDCNGTEYYKCDNCDGMGFHEWCRECGWDNIFNRFLSPKYEQEFFAKQAEIKEKADESNNRI